MKTLVRFILIALIIACPLIFSSCETSLPASGSHENLVTTQLRIGNLVCGGCSSKLQAALESHEGIYSAKIDHIIEPPAKNAIIEHQPDISLEVIKKIIADHNFPIEN